MNNLNDTEVRSVWTNIKIMLQGMTDTVSYTTHATSTVAQIGDSLAQAGLIMSKSNEELVKLDTQGEHAAKMEDLLNKYPALKATANKK